MMWDSVIRLSELPIWEPLVAIGTLSLSAFSFYSAILRDRGRLYGYPEHAVGRENATEDRLTGRVVLLNTGRRPLLIHSVTVVFTTHSARSIAKSYATPMVLEPYQSHKTDPFEQLQTSFGYFHYVEVMLVDGRRMKSSRKVRKTFMKWLENENMYEPARKSRAFIGRA